MTRAELRKGWCPSALRPMASGDGLIVRVHFAGGVLTPAHARALAQHAKTFGNGFLDLTARGNVQLRGVSETTLAPLQAALAGLGLLGHEDAPAVARNILVNPLAGRDPQAAFNISPCVDALRESLARDPALHHLPDKFSLVVDDGGAFSVANERSDLSFLARRHEGGAYFLVCLAGQVAGECALDALGEIALRAAHVFLELRDDPAARMAALVNKIGIEHIARKIGLTETRETLLNRETPPAIGAFKIGDFHIRGLGVSFGRLTWPMLERLATIAEESDASLRLTPWRAVLVLGKGPVDVAPLRDAGFILEEDDPLRAVAACPGAPACGNGTTATQDDARALAPAARRLRARGIAVHVSGCAKGCAHPSGAPVTFVARDGRYDLVLDGRADASPCVTGLDAAGLEDVLESFIVGRRDSWPGCAEKFSSKVNA